MKSSVPERGDDRETKNINILFHSDTECDEPDVSLSDFIHWQPLYDLYVFGDEVVITIEIPGVSEKDFTVHVYKHCIILKGKRTSVEVFTSDCCQFHNIELPYGHFYRRIELPVPVKSRKCQPQLRRGILSLKFPVVKERVIPIED